MRLQRMFRFKLGSKILAVKLNAWFEDLHVHKGITNETHDGFYIPFWDFVENISINDLHVSLKPVQEEWGLSSIYILQTFPKPSFRAFCFDKVEWREYIGILADTDLVDPSYLRHTVMRGRAVIRVTEKDGTKNKIVASLGEYSALRDWSLDHALLFNKLWKIYDVKQLPFLKTLKVRGSIYESFR